MLLTSFQNKAVTNKALIFNALFLIFMLAVGKADPMAVVFAYVFETVIIGILHLVKLGVIIRHNKPEQGSSTLFDYFVIPFFLIHYGAFVAIQSIIIYTIFAIKDERFSTSLSLNNFANIFNLEGFKWVALSLFVSHIFSLYFSFIKRKKYQNQSLGAYVIKPYLRIFIQQVLAIVPAFFLIYMEKVGVIGAVLLIVLRTALDYYFAVIASNPAKLNRLALLLLDKNKPNELQKIEQSLKAFLEE